jgi:hypothetical protein
MVDLLGTVGGGGGADATAGTELARAFSDEGDTNNGGLEFTGTCGPTG